MELTFTFEFSCGSQYVLNISKISSFDFNFTLADITLVRLSGKGAISIKSLGEIANKLSETIIENNFIGYYYCDLKEVHRRASAITPQEYRFKLFDLLYKRYGNLGLVKKDVIIYGEYNHFISLITKPSLEAHLQQVEEQLNELQNK